MLFGFVFQQSSHIATDVKVAPGGTENVDTEIYEAVVSQPIVEPQVSSDFNRQAAVVHPASRCSTLWVLLVCSLVSVCTRVRST